MTAAASAVLGWTLTAGAALAGEGQLANSHPQVLGPRMPVCNLCTVMVNGDGTVARGYGVKSVTKLAEGTYDIRFNGRVAKCFWQGTLADPGQGDATPGQITLAGRGNTNNGIYLKTFSPDGQPADHGFGVLVTCVDHGGCPPLGSGGGPACLAPRS